MKGISFALLFFVASIALTQPKDLSKYQEGLSASVGCNLCHFTINTIYNALSSEFSK